MSKRPISRMVGLQVVRLRTARGLSQERLAEAIGIDQSRLSRLERGHRSWDVELLTQACNALGVVASDLFHIAATTGDPDADDCSDRPRAV